VQLHLWRLKEQMKLQQQLYERLEAIAAHLQASETIDLKEFRAIAQPDVSTTRSRSCQSRSHGFSRDGIYEQSKSRPESIRVANVKLPLPRRENVHTFASGRAFNK
jgi:hypothetical protein